MIDLSKVKTPTAWPDLRSRIESEVSAVIGPLNRDKLDLQVKTVDEVEFRGYSRRRINYFVEQWDRISAWLFIPEGKEEVPAILCCHDMSPRGKDEPAGLDGDTTLAFAQRYAEMGYVTLAPDVATAGDRVAPKQKPYDTRAYAKEGSKQSFTAKMLSDHLRAIDVLCESKRVDSARLAVMGHGLGAYNALFLAAFDERIQACAASCGFTRFSTDKEPMRWVDEEGMNLMPKLKPLIESKDFPFDWEHILALAAPTATLIIASLYESARSNPKSCQKAVTLASRVYKLLGASSAIDHYAHHDGHRVTPETLEIVDEWFERWV